MATAGCAHRASEVSRLSGVAGLGGLRVEIRAQAEQMTVLNRTENSGAGLSAKVRVVSLSLAAVV